MAIETQSSIYSISAKRLNGENESLENYRGKVLLIVNVASKCGFTGQYKELQALYEEFKDRGFVILGFPCNQFGFQEPGDASQIEQFCSLTYNVSFPMFDKIRVNGSDSHPLYQHLKKERSGLLGSSAIKWNFTKFLVARDGKVVARFAPATTPAKIRQVIEEQLSR